MTKYKKLTRSTFAIVALCLALVGILAFGGTYAYFSANASAAGSVTTGTLTLGQGVVVSVAEDSLVPNQAVTVAAETDTSLAGNTVAAVRISLGEVTLSGGQSATLTPEQKALLTIEIDTTTNTNWVKIGNAYYYKNYVTELENIIANASVQIKLASTATNEWQGITANFTITIEAEQAEYVGEAGAVAANTAIDQGTVAALFA